MVVLATTFDRGTRPSTTSRARWLRDLRDAGFARDDGDRAAARPAPSRRALRGRPAAGDPPHLRGDELDDIAMQAADDALVGVLRRLDDFRGASRFTTWAYKFALLEAAVGLRKRAWQGRELPLEPEAWELVRRWRRGAPAGAAWRRLLEAVQPRFRILRRTGRVLVALAINGVPIDVLAERLGRLAELFTRPSTTRAAAPPRAGGAASAPEARRTARWNDRT